MSTTPVPNQQQQPTYEESALSSNYQGSGSVGPFFAVISVITILAVLSCVLGWACSARLEGVDSRYDCLEWVRERCRRCITHDVEVSAKVVENAGRDGKIQENEHQPAPPA